MPERGRALGGPIDILVNNAAAAMYGPVVEFPLKRRRILFEVNVHAPLDLAQAVAAGDGRAGRGLDRQRLERRRPPGPSAELDAWRLVRRVEGRAQPHHATASPHELAGTGVRVNTVEPRAAVMSEGAAALVGDSLRDDQIESMEAMVEAIVALCDCDLTGRTCVSLDLIAELGLAVHDLDGESLESRRTGAISNTARCPSRCLRSGQVPGERFELSRSFRT